MKKTKPWIRILMGLSASLIIADCIKYINNGYELDLEPKLYIRLGIVIASLAALYIKEFSVNNNFLIAAKDSYPYFISCYLFNTGTWLSWGLAFLLILWDFAGEG